MEKELQGKRILITGTGLKKVGHVFRDITSGKPSHTPILIDGQEYKANIGAATALACAQAGASVYMVARTEEKLIQLKQWIEREVPGSAVDFAAVDLKDHDALKRLVTNIPNDLPLYWVQSVGLGAGSVKLKDDNPYLPIEQLNPELIEAEISVLQNTIELLQLLLPRFRKQAETRVCIISSMSAIRSFASGSMHNAAKGAISRFANAAMIELDQEKIYITDVRPGGVDTGMYDAPTVREVCEKISLTYGTDWSEKNGGLRLAPSLAIGKAIAGILSSEAHITSINMVARGQWPHEGS